MLIPGDFTFDVEIVYNQDNITINYWNLKSKIFIGHRLESMQSAYAFIFDK